MGSEGQFSFEPNRDYTNVFFLMVDAKGHSAMVKENTSDKVLDAFDRFEDMVFKEVENTRDKHTCDHAEFWGWQGDGGLCVIYDPRESIGCRTAFEAAKSILDQLPALNSEITAADFDGTIEVRIALHRGSFTYRTKERRGSIHAAELNWCAHLEKVTPANSIALSADVRTGLSREDKLRCLPAPGTFEGRPVYLFSESESSSTLSGEWRQRAHQHRREEARRVAGLQHLFANRGGDAYAELKRGFESCRNGDIRMCGVSLRTFFLSGNPFREVIEGQADRYMSRDVKIRAVMCDHDCNTALPVRAFIEEFNPDGTYPDHDRPRQEFDFNLDPPPDLAAFSTEFYSGDGGAIKCRCVSDLTGVATGVSELNNRHRHLVATRLSPVAPYCTAVLFPDRCFFTPNLLSFVVPVALPMLVFHSSSDTYERVSEYFEFLWWSGRELSIG